MLIMDRLRFRVLLLLCNENSFHSAGGKGMSNISPGRIGRTIYALLLEDSCLVCHFENLGEGRQCVYLRRVELVLGTARA
jgi:hypothetical protein